MADKRSLTVIGDVTTAEAKSALTELLSDQRFHATDRAKAILSYLGDQYFSNGRDSVKAYAIAVDVLGRPESFDPTADPIARIEMSRLRSALVQYFEAFGQEKTIDIILPKGKYALCFVYRSNLPPERSKSPDLIATSSGSAIHWPSHIRKWWLPALIICVALVTAMLTTWSFIESTDNTAKPITTIEFGTDDDALLIEAANVRDALFAALGNFHTLSLRTNSDISIAQATGTRTFAIRIRYRADDRIRALWWEVKDGRRKEILGSGVVRIDGTGMTRAEIAETLASSLAPTLAASNGVPNAQLVKDEMDRSVLGNTCVLTAELYLASFRPVAVVQQCLEETVIHYPENSDALAALSRVLSRSAQARSSVELLARSRSLAERAVMLSPQSDRAHFALMDAYFRSGETTLAAETGKRALAYNPNNPQLRDSLALALYANSQWDDALNLIGHKQEKDITYENRRLLMLEAFRQQDWKNALKHAERLPSEVGLRDIYGLAARAGSQSERLVLPKETQAQLTAQMEWEHVPQSVREIILSNFNDGKPLGR
ncbi:hypothetical protein WH297_03365 [Ochrobactrum vermis]|uniref:Tetratricopeptide repeat protein n=1 Tax=Ochrobactrum vermis TaxID=1827297 RepID=A0ABU8P9R1_9HYPH|nr:hypothetical protein [Ochrobactrum vermis]PQZ29329.1 hypothetical protein CQZ93_03430 [Ochrobactrum vermis]